MSRPPLPIGTWGNINVTGKPGNYRARCRFRDYDGVTRDVERTGATKGAARAALTAALSERSTPTGSAIDGDTKLSEVAAVWLSERETDRDADKIATNTLRRYRDALEDHVLPGVGNLRVREATVSRLDRFIKSVATNTGPPTARLCATVLSGVLGLAVRHDAIPANPMRGVAAVAVKHKDPEALTLAEVAQLRATIRAWVDGKTADGKPKRGRPPSADIIDIVDMLLSTGARIGEVLALRWCDIDLDAGSVTICGTVILSDTKPSRPVRQPFPKGKKGHTLLLPRFGVDMLLRRSVNTTGNAVDAVFPSASGGWRDPNNLRKTWRKALADARLERAASPHVLRRTVATLLADDGGVDRAAEQLRHASADVTRRHYWDRPDVAADNRDVLDRFDA